MNAEDKKLFHGSNNTRILIIETIISLSVVFLFFGAVIAAVML